MPDRNRDKQPLLAIAFLVLLVGALWSAWIWSVGSFHAEKAEYAHRYAEAAQQDTRRYVEQTCRRVEPGAFVDCAIKAVNASEEAKRSEYDLTAQEQMARWTLWLTILGGLSLMVGAGGIYLVWGTLDATRVAALAAEESNRLMRGEQRAWLKFDLTEVTESFVAKDEFSIKAKYAIENVGKMPATQVRIYRTLEYIVIDENARERVIAMVERELGAHRALYTSTADPSNCIFPADTFEPPSVADNSIKSINPDGTVRRIFVLICYVFYRSGLSNEIFHTAVAYGLARDNNFCDMLNGDGVFENGHSEECEFLKLSIDHAI